jgi:hypothetical protein
MFTDSMPDSSRENYLTVLRATSKKPVTGLMAGMPVRAMTHYWQTKTWPCTMLESLECPLCMKGLSKRYYAYYPIRGRNGSAAVVELTGSAETALLDQLKLKDPRDLPIVKVTRAPGKRNNPLEVSVEFRHCSEEEWAAYENKIVDENLIKSTLCRLWNIPAFDPKIEHNEMLLRVSKFMHELVRSTDHS